ncbi:hypothetical protein PoB_004695300 [Plakobranchus ocellatus]|uniref:Uncharacterized protein n=1 Tax=Plakobranchus ocellatus TaxID=259542 RepID=A0AAV4BMU0_9GAST|nr:hypothetical protein PoB_004695300 [Plakobranchus ocellatus]
MDSSPAGSPSHRRITEVRSTQGVVCYPRLRQPLAGHRTLYANFRHLRNNNQWPSSYQDFCVKLVLEPVTEESVQLTSGWVKLASGATNASWRW